MITKLVNQMNWLLPEIFMLKNSSRNQGINAEVKMMCCNS